MSGRAPARSRRRPPSDAGRRGRRPPWSGLLGGACPARLRAAARATTAAAAATPARGAVAGRGCVAARRCGGGGGRGRLAAAGAGALAVLARRPFGPLRPVGPVRPVAAVAVAPLGTGRATLRRAV